MHMRKENRSLVRDPSDTCLAGRVTGMTPRPKLWKKLNLTIWSETWVGSLPILAGLAMSNVVFSQSLGDTTELWCLRILVFSHKWNKQKKCSFNASLGWKISSSLTCFFPPNIQFCRAWRVCGGNFIFMQHMDMTSSAARFWAFSTNFLPNHWGQNPVAWGRQQARTACTHLRPLLPK